MKLNKTAAVGIVLAALLGGGMGAANALPATGSSGAEYVGDSGSGSHPRTYIGNYATYAACSADGASPITGGSEWECEQQSDGSWDLYTS